jgi:hypothetical protein
MGSPVAAVRYFVAPGHKRIETVSFSAAFFRHQELND